MYSVLRANQCCAAIQERLNSLPEFNQKPKLYVLNSGFHGWLNHWYAEGKLDRYVEEFRSGNWVESQGKDGLVHIMDALWSLEGQAMLLDALKDISSNKERW